MARTTRSWTGTTARAARAGPAVVEPSRAAEEAGGTRGGRICVSPGLNVLLAPPLRRWRQPTAGLGIGTAVRGLWLSGLWCPGHGSRSARCPQCPSLSPSFSQRHRDPADWGGKGGPGSLGVQCSCAMKPQRGRHALRLGCPRWPGWIEASVDPKRYPREQGRVLPREPKLEAGRWMVQLPPQRPLLDREAGLALVPLASGRQPPGVQASQGQGPSPAPHPARHCSPGPCPA